MSLNDKRVDTVCAQIDRLLNKLYPYNDKAQSNPFTGIFRDDDNEINAKRERFILKVLPSALVAAALFELCDAVSEGDSGILE